MQKLFRRSAVFLSLIPASVRAYSLTDTGWNCDGFLYCGTGATVVGVITSTIVGTVAAFIIPLAVIVFIYGGIRMITSQGQEGKETGKKAMIYAALGLVFALLVAAIVSFVHDYIYFLGG